MPFYVYIIQSLADDSYYKGFSEDPLKRLQQHNNKESNYTAHKTPWKLLYVESCDSKKDVLIPLTAKPFFTFYPLPVD